MRRVGLPAVTAAMLALCGVLGADEPGESPRNVVPPDRLHRPQDVAPPELVIVPRPPSEYRPEGSLLRTAHHRPRRVDIEELHRRKLDMYAGHVIPHPLPSPSGTVSSVARAKPEALKPGQERNLAGTAWWCLVAGCAVAAFWLFGKVFINLCRGRHPLDEGPILTSKHDRWQFADDSRHARTRRRRTRRFR